MSVTERVQAAAVMSSTTSTGAKIPKQVTDSFQRAVRISDGVRSNPAPQGALAVAVASALERGDDPAIDRDLWITRTVCVRTRLQSCWYREGRGWRPRMQMPRTRLSRTWRHLSCGC
jgi:hypothetical protein